ncbi:MAG: tRNA dihydrouridine synthase [Candidatus Saccharimonadales bacterium]
MDFWEKLEKGFSCLAPMEGVTDIVFRQVVLRAGRPDVYFTEFTNVNSFVSEAGRPNALERFRYLDIERPIVAQIWGTKPEYFAATAKGLRELGYAAVDINMGCPDKHVVANGGGSALIRTPELAVEIIRETKTAGLPVSAKTRLGYSKVEEWKEWLTTLLDQDLAALTVHLRTKKEMSKVDAHYELVLEIVALRNELAPKTKLIINGDIKTPAEGEKFVAMGADGIMIGRGVFANPFCFEREPKEHSKEELAELLKYHLDLYDEYKLMTFDPLKRFFKIYISGFYGASEIREKLMNCKNTDEVREILNSDIL